MSAAEKIRAFLNRRKDLGASPDYLCGLDNALAIVESEEAKPDVTAGLIEALRILVDAVGRYQEIGPLKGVKTDLEKGHALGLKALKQHDTGKIKPGHVCRHHVRWPHACDECDDAALEAAERARAGK